MSLKLMYITNKVSVALIAEKYGVDRIFVDMEYIGKDKRQGQMDTVQNHHTIDDVRILQQSLTKSELMVRINPVHEASKQFGSSEEEIEAAIEAGADILMLPYFKQPEEVERFIRIVDGRVRTMPLVETPEAVAAIDEILSIPGIDEIYVGFNDLRIGYGKRFLFEFLIDGTADFLCKRFREKGIPYGFGGLGRIGHGTLPAEYILSEHYRLGSSSVILSRSFCNANILSNLSEIDQIFCQGIQAIRHRETICSEADTAFFAGNHQEVKTRIEKICEELS